MLGGIAKVFLHSNFAKQTQVVDGSPQIPLLTINALCTLGVHSPAQAAPFSLGSEGNVGIKREGGNEQPRMQETACIFLGIESCLSSLKIISLMLVEK